MVKMKEFCSEISSAPDVVVLSHYVSIVWNHTEATERSAMGMAALPIVVPTPSSKCEPTQKGLVTSKGSFTLSGWLHDEKGTQASMPEREI
jgi:hypothetical protein